MTTTLEDLAARIARLEQNQAFADIHTDIVSVRRDIIDLASGVGTDLRAIRQDTEGIRRDTAWMRGELTEIRRLLQRQTFRWPWERA